MDRQNEPPEWWIAKAKRIEFHQRSWNAQYLNECYLEQFPWFTDYVSSPNSIYVQRDAVADYDIKYHGFFQHYNDPLFQSCVKYDNHVYETLAKDRPRHFFASIDCDWSNLEAAHGLQIDSKQRPLSSLTAPQINDIAFPFIETLVKFYSAMLEEYFEELGKVQRVELCQYASFEGKMIQKFSIRLKFIANGVFENSHDMKLFLTLCEKRIDVDVDLSKMLKFKRFDVLKGELVSEYLFDKNIVSDGQTLLMLGQSKWTRHQNYRLSPFSIKIGDKNYISSNNVMDHLVGFYAKDGPKQMFNISEDMHKDTSEIDCQLFTPPIQRNGRTLPATFVNNDWNTNPMGLKPLPYPPTLRLHMEANDPECKNAIPFLLSCIPPQNHNINEKICSSVARCLGADGFETFWKWHHDYGLCEAKRRSYKVTYDHFVDHGSPNAHSIAILIKYARKTFPQIFLDNMKRKRKAIE